MNFGGGDDDYSQNQQRERQQQMGQQMGQNHQQQQQQQQQNQQHAPMGDNAFRELRERELTLALMNQQIANNSPQGQPPSLTQPSGLPNSILADIYASQQGNRQDPPGSLLSQSARLQSGGAGLGGFDNQNQLLYTDALNRMMPSSTGGAGGLGMGSTGSGANPYSNLNLQSSGGVSDPSPLMFSGALGGMQSGALAGMQSGALAGMQSGALAGMQSGALGGMQGMQSGSLGGMQHAALGGMQSGSLGGMQSGSLGGMGGMQGMNRLPTGATGAAGGMPSGGLDPLTAAFLRDNNIMRERLGARGTNDLQMNAGNSGLVNPFLGGGNNVPGARDWTARSLQQQLLAGSQLPSSSAQAANQFMGGLGGASTLALQQQQGMGAGDGEDGSKFPVCLPVTLAVPEDNQKLSSHQVLLRNQIEAFKATEDDLTTHTRGRNKPIKMGQIGIRCRHCARLPVARRQKGSTYFPASLHGLYQAAQNMNTTHMQSGLCTEMPPEYKQMFSEAMANKVSSSVAGRPYWAKTAKQLGLIDTEDGIRFVRDLSPAQIAQIKAMQQQQLQQRQGGNNSTKGIPARLLS